MDPRFMRWRWHLYHFSILTSLIGILVFMSPTFYYSVKGLWGVFGIGDPANVAVYAGLAMIVIGMLTAGVLALTQDADNKDRSDDAY